MSRSKPAVTIDHVFEEFLADQKTRLGHTTFSKYESILDLLRSCLESYWPGHDQKEYDRITKAGGTFCGTFGPEDVLGGLSEFLGYFMPRKVVASKDTMKAAGTVTKMLVKWLAGRDMSRTTRALTLPSSEPAGQRTICLPAKT